MSTIAMVSRLTDLDVLVSRLKQATAANNVVTFDAAADQFVATLRDLRGDIEWQGGVAQPLAVEAVERVAMRWHQLNGGENPSD